MFRPSAIFICLLSIYPFLFTDPNVFGPYELYPLHLAAKYNSVDAAKYLLQHGANVLCRDCKQKTPLHHAARKGHQEMVEVSEMIKLYKLHVLVLIQPKVHPFIKMSSKLLMLYGLEWHSVWLTKRDYIKLLVFIFYLIS